MSAPPDRERDHPNPVLSPADRQALAESLCGAGRRWLRPGADPIGDLIREREEDQDD